MKTWYSGLKWSALLALVACSSYDYRTVPLSRGETRENHEAWGKSYMIATQGHYSTQAGAKMFELGGNAVDAAAAISFVISVERPQSTGIGGGGFMLYGNKKLAQPLTVDFREKAPLKAHERMFVDKDGNVIPKKSLDGIFAAGVPGLVAGVLEVHQKYGKLPLKDVLQPAIDLAEQGFKVYPELASALQLQAEVLTQFQASKDIFFKDGKPMVEGDLLIQKDLGKTLRAIAKNGKNGFYRGWVADAIVAENRRLQGLMSHQDLRQYQVKYRKPVTGTYKEYEVYSMSPPSSGGIHVIQIMNTVEKDNLGQLGAHHPQTVHITASAMQQAFADRAKYLGDTDFVKVPVKGLTSKAYAEKIRSEIPNDRARTKEQVMPGDIKFLEADHTTHFSVMDAEGNVVVSTQTINGHFGAGVVVPGTGIVLNNEMDDFATKVGAQNLFGAVGGENNLVSPQKRPLSSMSPTIVYKDKKPVLAVGTPSGTRILTCVAQTILNYVEHKLPLYDAVAAVRYHQQWAPDEIRTDEDGLPSSVERALTKMGHTVKRNNLGCRVQAIAYEGDQLHGVSDPRGQGESFGK